MKVTTSCSNFSINIAASTPVTFTPETGKEEVAEGQQFNFNMGFDNSEFSADMTPEEFNHEVSCLLEENKDVCEKLFGFMGGVVDKFGDAAVAASVAKTNINSYRAETERQEADVRAEESRARTDESRARAEEIRSRINKDI